jgi:hypothetical protein
MDLTRVPVANASRLTITPWAADRLDIPMIAVDGRNHGSLVSDPEPGMMDLVAAFLGVSDRPAEEAWLARARQYSQAALPKMKINPGAAAAGIEGDVKNFFAHILGHGPGVEMEGWQQFVVHARDEHGDGISDFMIEVLTERDGAWTPFTEMYTDVHPYGPDPSFRCFHLRLPAGISAGGVKLKVRINASTGTDLMAYQGYGSEARELGATAEPVEIDLEDLGNGNGSLFHPFTTTLIEIVLNREPLPLNKVSQILTFLDD